MDNTINAVKINGKEVDTTSFEFDDVHLWDYPDFCDAYVSSANFTDGTPLSDEELESLSNVRDLLYEKLIESLF